jgi:hypothetical protein
MRLSKTLPLLLTPILGLLLPLTAQGQEPRTPTPPAPPDRAAPDHPAIEPGALAILKATSDRLSGAKSLIFTAVSMYEAPAINGQPLYYATQSDVALQRPNKLRIVTPGDGPAWEFYYDGKAMVAYSPVENLVAISDAPPTMTDMLKVAYDRAAIYFPFADVLSADPYKDVTEGLTSAFVVGQSHVIGGGVTDMIAIANDNVQAELWIGIDDGLPRMIRATYPKDPARLHYEVQFRNWRLDAPLRPSDFASAQASKAPRMEFARPDTTNPARPQ